MSTAELLCTLLIFLPFPAAIACYLIRGSTIRSGIILITGGVLIAGAVLLIPLTPFSLTPQPIGGVSIHVMVQALDFLLLLIILYFGFKYRHIVIKALAGIYRETGTLELQRIIISGNIGAGVCLLSLALLCLAAFTKSAQFPFQSWLLGAMVAPTPVSALLHSSTMVNVGVYLVLRLAPAINGTFLSQCVALFGAFTFLAVAALAVGQSNGKKVLAYSTISNLGLIFACAGLNTPESIVAGLLSTAAPWLYTRMIVPALSRAYPPPYTTQNGILENPYGAFAVFPLSLVAALGFVIAILAVKRAAKARVVSAYLSGVQTAESGVFTGPMNQLIKAEAKNYYLSSIFGEKKLTTWINLAAGLLLTLMVGGTL